jgi:hypothetical protein
LERKKEFEMKTTARLMLVLVVLFVAAPGFAGEAVQMWKCEMDDDASEAQVKAMAEKWLNAAKKQPGGEGLDAYVLFPIAVNGVGEMDMMFVVTAPSFQDWGKFWDAYGGSPANAIDQQNEALIVCPNSVVWEKFSVK